MNGPDGPVERQQWAEEASWEADAQTDWCDAAEFDARDGELEVSGGEVSDERNRLAREGEESSQ